MGIPLKARCEISDDATIATLQYVRWAIRFSLEQQSVFGGQVTTLKGLLLLTSLIAMQKVHAYPCSGSFL